MATVTNSNLFQIEPGILNKNACVVIVRTEWNAGTVDKLEEGCRRILEEQEVRIVETLVVPGAFEIPYGIKIHWDISNSRTDRPDAYVALGCVLRGDTPHFEYVSKAVTDGIMQLNLQLPVPVIFGVLTVDNQQQADERTGGRHGHKGEEAAVTALKMINLKI